MCTCNFTMNVYSIRELLQPCMLQTHQWFKDTERAALFADSTYVPFQAYSEPDTLCTGKIGDYNTRIQKCIQCKDA